MATINQLRRERLAFFAELKRALRDVDSAIESNERLINRVLGRRLNVPEQTDYEKFVSGLTATIQAIAALERVVQTGTGIFSILG